MLFARITIPAEMARRVAIATDPTTAGDVRYEIKTILGEAYGPNALRPWRILPSDEYEHEVIGCVRDEKALSDQSVARRNGFKVRLDNFMIADGSEIELDVHASPAVKISRRDPETRKVIHRTYVDVPSAFVGKRDMVYPTRAEPTPADSRAAYQEWFATKMSEERTGMQVDGRPILISSGTVQAIRKRAVGPDRYPVMTSSSPSSIMHPDGRIRAHMILPFAQARVNVVVRDRDRTEAFLGHGLQGKKDIGMGSMIPVHVLDAMGVGA